MWKVHREKKKKKKRLLVVNKVTFDSCTSNYSWHLCAHSWDHHPADKSDCAGASLTPGPRHPFCQLIPLPSPSNHKAREENQPKLSLIYGHTAVRIVNWKMLCQIILKHEQGGKGKGQGEPSCCAVVSATKVAQRSALDGGCPHRHENSLV